MRREILSILFLACVTFLSAQENAPAWEIVNIVDKFGDTTDQKRVVYQTTGVFSNSATTDSRIDVLLYSDNPKKVSVIVFEYGKYRVNLSDAIFYYKIGERVIEGVAIEGEVDYRSLFFDEKTSFFYLLKQGGEIKVRAYNDNSSYFFIIDAANFLETLGKAFNDQKTTIEYEYEIADMNGVLMNVSIEISYKWTKEKERRLKENEEIERIAIEFFSNVNRNFAFDKPGGYYQREKVMESWGIPLFEHIKELFPNEYLELVSISAM